MLDPRSFRQLRVRKILTDRPQRRTTLLHKDDLSRPTAERLDAHAASAGKEVKKACAYHARPQDAEQSRLGPVGDRSDSRPWH